MRIWLALLLGLATLCRAAMLPSATVPDGLGINIHFTGAPAHDLDLIQGAGFRFIRMDVLWDAVEKTKGVYNFDAYDQLTAGLKQRGIRPLYILCYGNTLYEKERGLVTDEGRAAFTHFAAAAAAHFRGQGVIWELWNEPNYETFWTPKPSVDGYMQLAKAALPAVRAADPTATIIAPALSTIDIPFLEGCFQRGLLGLVDAVSVHPYRDAMPETVAEDITHIHVLIAKYAPDRPNLPVLSGEWGYTITQPGIDTVRQGQTLARMMLTNLSQGVPLSIWYDWHEKDGSPTNGELHYGIVTLDDQPKPNYLALQHLTLALSGMHFVKRLTSAPADYLLLFSDNTRWTLAAWTTDKAHLATLWPGQCSTLSGDPLYVSVPTTATEMLAEGAWTATPASYGVGSGAAAAKPIPAVTVQLRNPFAHAVTVSIATPTLVNITGHLEAPPTFTLKPGETAMRQWTGGTPPRRDLDATVQFAVTVDGVTRQQTVRFQVANPVLLHTVVLDARHLGAQLTIPDDEAFDGTLTVHPGAQLTAVRVQVHPATHEITASYQDHALTCMHTSGGIIVPFPEELDWSLHPGGFTLSAGNTVVADSGPAHVRPLETTTKTVAAVNDGDGAVPATFTLTDVPNPPDVPITSALRLDYDVANGWKFVRIAPPVQLPLEGTPHALGVWVRGNQTHYWLSMRYTDAAGRMWQPVFGELNFTGWRFLTVRLDDPTAYHWGGVDTNPGITYPISLNTFITVDSTRVAVKDSVEFAGFQVMY